ncbi:uncharacterized protein I303_103149 [Kwoniella dejecticola CBS 10117]|uniref:Uncharacterized protein n=1 Tax=Kwoniella dejecticola CBS 10117 TaxID=1296121 RepID=A0A1A6AAQ8_9TREE|nr:uncharacterized protein I303_03170 [Kwoniella dejecticola CBS 10117]OBR87146.1 hypothetical protein I303_03170 [Kwoniella dejecticola CBS 10117]
MPACARCLKIESASYELEQTENGEWACPFCGVVDNALTARSQLKDYAKDAGSVMDENARLQMKEQQDRLRRKFQEETETMFNLYLGINSPHTSILGRASPDLKHGAKQWFERMREAEKKHKPNRIHLLQRAESRRTKYLVAISIKLAAEESALIVLQNRLASAGVTLRNKRNVPGYTKGDESVEYPDLHDIFHRANNFASDSFGHLDSGSYLRHLFNRYSRWVDFVLTPVEIVLLHCLAIMRRLQFLVELPHAERTKHLHTLPKVSKGERDWYESDFAGLEDTQWAQVLPHAYQLYQIQECVRLWGASSSPQVAIALVQWAVQSSSKSVLYQHSALQQELAHVYGRGHTVAAERFRDLRNLLIAWSTSITDAGLPFPIMDLPAKGGLGDGVSGYRGDGRRAIPDIELAVAAAPIIVKHWRRILKARLSQRLDVMSLEDETWLSRKMYIVSAQVHHYRQDPRAQLTKSQVLQRPTSWVSPSLSPSPSSSSTPLPPSQESTRYKPRFSDKFKINAENARKAILAFEPLKRVRPRPPPVKSWIPGEALQHYQANLPVPAITQNSFELKHYDRFVPPPPEKSIERLIQEPELSSDEEDGYTSDEEGNVTVIDSAHQLQKKQNTYIPSTLAQIDANARSAINASHPFAFTIGPNGFNRDSNAAAPTATQTLPRSTLKPVLDSSSDLSNSPVLMSRQSSIESSSGIGSASETESVIRHPHGRLTVNGLLNTPTASAQASPVRSPAPRSNNAPNVSVQSRSFPQARTPSPAASSSSSTQLKESNGREDSHVGLLVREREEYVQFRLPNLEREGILVPSLCEDYMWKWIRAQVNNGTMPKVINQNQQYLRSIGISGDPHKIDLGPWVQSNSHRWSPLECLLRAGIKPKEIPVQHIPHSLIHTKILLRHFNTVDPFVAVGQAIDDAQLDQEIKCLCHEELGESMDSYLCTKKEYNIRKAAYEEEMKGYGEADLFAKKKRRATSASVSVPRDTPLRELDAEEMDDEDEMDVDPELLDDDENQPSSPTPSQGVGSPNYRRDISRLKRSLLYSSGTRKDVEGIGGLLKKSKPAGLAGEGGESDGGGELDMDFNEMIGVDIRTIGLGSEFGFADEIDDLEGDEQDQVVPGNGKSTKTKKVSAKAKKADGPSAKKRKISTAEEGDGYGGADSSNTAKPNKKVRTPSTV